jgi:hypothetical protein
VVESFLPVVAADDFPVVAFPLDVDFPVVDFPPVVAEEGVVFPVQLHVPLTTTNPLEVVEMRVVV